jgi:MFS family permease
MRHSISLGKIAPILLAIVIDSMGFGLVYPVMTALFSDTTSSLFAQAETPAMRHFYLGLSFMLYPFGMFFGASFLGDLSDILGRKKVLLICMAGLFASFFLMGLGVTISSVSILLLGRLLGGLMAGSQPIAQAAISDQSTEETKPLNMSIMTLALSFGIVSGPLIGGFFSDPSLSSAFSFSTPFYLAAVLCLIDLIWIYLRFGETFIQKANKTLHLLRPIHIFIEAFKHKSIRFLSLVFALMQIGFSLYFQLILVLLNTRFHYSSWQLGVFNGFIGFGFVIALIFLMRLFLKFWNIRQIAAYSFLITGLGQIGSVLIPNQWIIWGFAFPVATFDMLAYTATLTNFSNAVDSKSQGWAMGISGSIMALTWAISGLSTTLIPVLGLNVLIFIGGIFLVISFLLMVFHTPPFIKKEKSFSNSRLKFFV